MGWGGGENQFLHFSTWSQCVGSWRPALTSILDFIRNLYCKFYVCVSDLGGISIMKWGISYNVFRNNMIKWSWRPLTPTWKGQKITPLHMKGLSQGLSPVKADTNWLANSSATWIEKIITQLHVRNGKKLVGEIRPHVTRHWLRVWKFAF